MTESTLWTVARIAARAGVARHRVEYVIDSRGISPIGRAGIARIFDARDAEFISHELDRIEADRLKTRRAPGTEGGAA